jgi:ATP-dependent DNA ligase
VKIVYVDGRPSFDVLQDHHTGAPTLHFYTFELLTLCDKDLTCEPLERRREILRTKVMAEAAGRDPSIRDVGSAGERGFLKMRFVLLGLCRLNYR